VKQRGERMQKLEDISLLRALSCLAVIMIHVTAFIIFLEDTGETAQIFLSFLNALSVFAVPAFLLISGYTLSYKYTKVKMFWGQFFGKRLSNVLVPYICWTVLYYALFVVQGMQSLSFSLLLKNLLLGNMVYHLYFVVIIVQFYLLFGVFRFLWSRFDSFLLPLAFLIINILFMRYFSFMYIDRFFMRYVFFFVWGGYAAQHREQFQGFLEKQIVRIVLLIGYLLMAVRAAIRYYQKFVLGHPYDVFTEDLYWVFYCTVAILCYWSITILLSRTGPVRIKKLLDKISSASYYIYLAHPLAIFAAQYLMNKLSVYSTSTRLILVCGLIFGVVFPLAILYQEKKGTLFKMATGKCLRG